MYVVELFCKEIGRITVRIKLIDAERQRTEGRQEYYG